MSEVNEGRDRTPEEDEATRVQLRERLHQRGEKLAAEEVSAEQTEADPQAGDVRASIAMFGNGYPN